MQNIRPRDIILTIVGIVVAIAAITAGIIFTNRQEQITFQTVGYTNSTKISYSMNFYSKHINKTLDSGNSQLVAQSTRSNKFPVGISITNGNIANYETIRECTGYKKVFDVQNDNLKQNFAVCDILSDQEVKGKSAANSVYVTAFRYEDQAHIVTIAQDYTSNVPSKIGLLPYREDIEKILASIQVK